MKKVFKYFIFTITCFLLSIYSVYAEEDINIKSIRVVGQSGTITLNDLDYSENNIYSNIIFNQVNDFVTYEVELENSSYKKYLLESISISNSEYLTASSDEVSTYIDPKGTSTIQLKVKYENELINVEEINLDNLSLTLNYSYEGITNPETGFNLDYIILFIIALSLIEVGFVLFKIKKKQVIVLLLLLPMVVLAKEYKPVTITFSNIKVNGRLLNYRVEVDNGSGEFSLRQRTYGEEVGMLATPTKSGYTFTGWKDQDGNQITEETQIEKDIVVSAQFEPIEYTITYNLDGGVLSKENPTTYTTEDEFTINNPTKEGYTFVGWDIGIESYPKFTIYKGMINDITLTALYTQEPTAQYTVIHKKENSDGEFVEAEREVLTGVVGLQVCPRLKIYEGYYAWWGECLTITEDGMSSVTYNYYRARLSFEVTSFDGLDIENSNQSGIYPYGTTITLNAEERPGYTLWWSDGETGFSRTFSLTKNTTLSAQYIPNGNVQYKVIHKLQNFPYDGELAILYGIDEIDQVNDGYYVEDISYFDGLVGEEVEPPTNIYEGFTAPSVERITLSTDGSKTITYYYTRNKYRLTIEEEENVETDTPSGEYYYGTWINLKAKKIEGYYLEKWSDGSIDNPHSFELKGDTSIKAIYTEAPYAEFDTGSIVNYKLKNISGNSNASTYSYDEYIQKIKRASALPSDFYPTYSNVVSSTRSGYAIYIWYDNGIVYYFTGADKIYLNANSSYMFNGLKSLNEIEGINSFDTSNVTNMAYLFASVGLNIDNFYLDLSNWDTSNVEKMDYMFFQAGNKASSWNVDGLANWDTSKVTNMGMMFSSTGKNVEVWSVDGLSNWNTSNVTKMNGMFSGIGQNSKKIYITGVGNWDTSRVTDMSSMFGAAGFQSANVCIIDSMTNWNVSNVKTFSGMFSNACATATTWNIGDLSNWDTSSVESFSMMFSCTGQRTTTWSPGDLSNWNTSNVTNMSHMFTSAGHNATEWNIGDLSNWDTSNVTNMSSMFSFSGQKATAWNIGDLSNWDTSNVVDMKEMFYQAGYHATTWNSIGTLKVYSDNITNMFYQSPKAKVSLAIYSNPTSYDKAFNSAATASGSGITVNYKSTTTNIDNIIATKSSNSNVYKGSLIS